MEAELCEQDDPDSRVLAEWQQVLRARQEAAHAVEAANVGPPAYCPEIAYHTTPIVPLCL